VSNRLNLNDIEPVIIGLGSHPGIIQSILDYDYCIGRKESTVIAIVAGGRKQERYFYGTQEIVLPVYPSLAELPDNIKQSVTAVVDVQSARHALEGMRAALTHLPNLKLVNIFAEQVPEAHALEIRRMSIEKGVLVLGPASVGILLPGRIKLGAIGGIYYPQFVAANIFVAGNVAVVSTSGGMVNELIHVVTSSGLNVSLALALGGDRNPITTPADAFLLAESDSATERIVYFGELGGEDEYELADMINQGRITKPVTAYIAGTVAELFKEPPQFGHAKAMAASDRETARAKKAVLAEAGVQVLDVFSDLGKTLSAAAASERVPQDHRPIAERRKSLAVSRVSGEVNGDIHLLGQDLLTTVESNSLAGLYISLLLGENITSPKLIELADFTFRLLVDHGPHVSGAINTIVSARAGKDLASSLATGILTIGPRFGGAVNGAASAWLEGVRSGASAKDFVIGFKEAGGIIPGIGHKKYRIDMPDPRVESLISKFAGSSNDDRYLKFARSVENVTTGKKGNLILNVDGAIAALMLDRLESELGYDQTRLRSLIDSEFFNALFILSRSVGFMAHYLDQRRHDEGLLRLSDNEIIYIP
jgi:ATP citrate (pro-S)-lyase